MKMTIDIFTKFTVSRYFEDLLTSIFSELSGYWKWTRTSVPSEEFQVVVSPQQPSEKPRAIPRPRPGTEPGQRARQGERAGEREGAGLGESEREGESQ